MPATSTKIPSTYTNPKTLVPSNLQLWLDASDTSSMTASSGNVSVWNDKSTVGNNTTAPSGHYPSVTTNTQNGLSVMTFSGSQNLTGAISLGGTTFTQFVVYSNSAVTVGQAFMDSSDGPVGKLCAQNGGGNQFQAGFAYGSSFQTGSAYRIVSTNCSNPGSSSTVSIWFNGTNQNIGGWNFYGAGTTAITGVTIGARKDLIYFSGTIAEIIVYSTALSSTDQKTIEGYLAQKWGLTANLPAGHPGLTTTIYAPVVSGNRTVITKIPYYQKFSPTQISGCQLWMDAADITTMTIATGSISQWNDKSGNGYSFSNNATLTPWNYGSSYYPTITYGGLNKLNVVTFNTQSLGCVDVFPAGNAQSFSIFLVGTSFMGRGEDGYGGGWSVSIPDYLGSIVLVANGAVGYTMTNGSGLLNYLELSQGTTSVINTYNSGSLVQSQSVGNYTLRTSSIGLEIGRRSGYYKNGYIAEILIYTRVLSSTERQQVESYLAQKWGLVSSLPSGHLQNTFPAGSPTIIQSLTPSVVPTLAKRLTSTFNGSVSSGLIAYFTFDNQILDAKSTIPLNVIGGIQYITGKYGNSIYLANEANSAASTTATNYLTSPYNVTVPFSISLWFKPTNTTSGSMFSSYNSIAVTAYSVNLYIQNGSVSAAYNAIQNVGASSSVSIGTWYYTVITVNSSNGLTLFINGSQVGSTITQTPSINGLMIGNIRDNGGSYPFSGYLDDYRIYNRVLSGAEISAIYAGTG